MKASFILLVFIIVSFVSLGQNRNSVWCFGDSAGIDFSNLSNPTPLFSAMDDRGSCSSIADVSGNLLFYCFSTLNAGDSATLVYNYLNDTLINGDHLIGAALYNQIVIFPFPDDSNKYYIFHLGYYTAEGLYYSIVDMSLNSGQGAVIQKNIQLSPLIQGDCISAIKHGNGRDWWVISKLGGNGVTQFNRFFVYIVSSSNIINANTTQDFGGAVDAVQQKMAINKMANKLMLLNTGGFMAQYDFDRCTGIISNPNIIYPQQLSNFNRYFFFGAYSPNDSLFYASTFWYSFPNDTSRLLQFNLFSPNIPASCDTLFENSNPKIFGAVRLAPDNKIYMTSYYNWGFPGFPYPDSVYNMYNMNLSVINNPDSPGAACNFMPYSFYLGGKRTYAGLPNNPNYELGPLYGSPCDSLSAGVNELAIKNNAALLVFYHNAWQVAFINAKALKGKKYKLNVLDMAGKMVFKEEGKLNSGYFTKDLNCVAFANGIYIVDFKTEKEMLVQKFVKQ